MCFWMSYRVCCRINAWKMSIQGLLRIGKTRRRGSFENAGCYKPAGKEDKFNISSDVNDMKLKCGAACFDCTFPSWISLLTFLVLASNVTWITTCILCLHACMHSYYISIFISFFSLIIIQKNKVLMHIPALFKIHTCMFHFLTLF